MHCSHPPKGCPRDTPNCFVHCHDKSCFGLGYGDTKLASKRTKKDWKYPTAAEIKQNKKEIKQLKKAL
jgi:hypothetical protein